MATDTAPEEDPGGLLAIDRLTDRVRESAKWLIGGFAAVAALILPGLGVADLGKLSDARLIGALLFAAAALVAAIGAIAYIARVLGSEAPTLGELASRWRKYEGGTPDELMTWFEAHPTVLQGQAEDLNDLLVRLGKAKHDEAAKRLDHAEYSAEPLAGTATDDDKQKRKNTLALKQALADAAAGRLQVISDAMRMAEATARYRAARKAFVDVRPNIVALTAVVALGIAGFAVAAHPPAKRGSNFEDATIRGLDLSGTNLEDARFDGARMSDVDMTDADLGSAQLDDALIERSTCPDGAASEPGDAGCDEHEIFVPDPLMGDAGGARAGG